jgi:hypothetical protein
MEPGRIDSSAGGFKAKCLADRARIAFINPTLCIYPMAISKSGRGVSSKYIQLGVAQESRKVSAGQTDLAKYSSSDITHFRQGIRSITHPEADMADESLKNGVFIR